MYSKVGRASVPPERLLKASLPISLYSVRSERAFCEELEYNLVFRWFLDMNLMKHSFDPTAFTKNQRRLLEHEIGQALFDEAVWEADRQGLLSNGLLMDFVVSSPTGTAERDAVPVMLDDARERGFRPKAMGRDREYETRECVKDMRDRGVTPARSAANSLGDRWSYDTAFGL